MTSLNYFIERIKDYVCTVLTLQISLFLKELSLRARIFSIKGEYEGTKSIPAFNFVKLFMLPRSL